MLLQYTRVYYKPPAFIPSNPGFNVTLSSITQETKNQTHSHALTDSLPLNEFRLGVEPMKP